MRHRQRHLHATIVRLVLETLTETGWVRAPINFGTLPVTVLDYEPQGAGQTPAFNTVAVSIGHQGSDDAIELGGGVQECRYTVFIDVYPVNESIGVAIADDIKAAINDEYIAMRDFTTAPDGVERADMWIEFEDVMVETIPSAASTLDKRSWRSVKATAVCFF